MSGSLCRNTYIIGALTLLFGCATCPEYTKLDIPPKPHIIPITAEQQARTPTDVLDIFAVNQVTLKNHILRLEARIEAANDSLE
jgi:hypothetical protein